MVRLELSFLQDIGIDTMAASGILGLMATMSLPGRLVFAWIGDKYGNLVALMVGYTLKAIALVIWISASSMTQVIMFVVIFGMGYGGSIPTASSLRANYFGRKAYATITGYVTFFQAITNIAYPVFAGWSYDVTGSYVSTFTIATGIQVLAIIAMYFAKKPKPPIQVDV